MAKWAGVLLVAPGLWFLCFFVMDYVCGDTRRSPWGLLMVALCAHIAPEGMMNGPFYLTTVGAVTVIFVSFLAAYVLPIISGLIMKRRKVPVVAQRRSSVTSVPGLRTGRLPERQRP